MQPSPGDADRAGRPLRLPFVDLDRAARIQAAQASPDLRADVYQAAWVRFLRHDPYSFGGAVLMARHAMIDVVQQERRHWHAPLFDVETEPEHDAELLLDLADLFPDEVAVLLTYYRIPQPTPAQRTRASRMRSKIRKAIDLERDLYC